MKNLVKIAIIASVALFFGCSGDGSATLHSSMGTEVDKDQENHKPGSSIDEDCDDDEEECYDNDDRDDNDRNDGRDDDDDDDDDDVSADYMDEAIEICMEVTGFSRSECQDMMSDY